MDNYNEYVQDILLGIKSSVPYKNGVKLETEGFIIIPNQIDLRNNSHETEVTLGFCVHHDTLLPSSIEDTIYALGESTEQAIGNAIRLWVEGTLPVLHYLHHGPMELSSVTKIALSSRINSTSVQTYELICGPVQNDTKEARKKETPEKESKIIEALQDPLSSHLQEEETFCIVANITKKGEEIRTQCTINNEAWSAGSEALHYWADHWGFCNTPKVQKQFFICIPQKN